MDAENCTCNGFAPSWAGKNVFVTITGASRGFGLALSQEIFTVMCAKAECCPESITLFLVGRQSQSLEATKSKVEEMQVNCSCKVKVVIDEAFLIDFAHVSEDQIARCFSAMSAEVSSRNLSVESQVHLLFNNAATLGDITKKAHELDSIKAIDCYTRINFSSMIVFTNEYLKNMKTGLICVVNVSSIAGLVPFKHMTEYCSIKAARTMYMRCLAVDKPSIALFNYSPGPLKTDMWNDLIKNLPNSQCETVKEMEENRQVMEPNKSAKECVSWLGFLTMPGSRQGSLCRKHHADVMGLFSGSQLDYFDAKELPNPYRLA